MRFADACAKDTQGTHTTGCTAFSVQEYCDRRLIPLSHISCVEFLRNYKPKPCKFSPAIPCLESAREYVMVFSQFVRKYSTSVATSGILNEYLFTVHTLGSTSGNLTKYLYHGPSSNFGGKPQSLRPREYQRAGISKEHLDHIHSVQLHGIARETHLGIPISSVFHSFPQRWNIFAETERKS